jgi:solute carrier family 25 protein 39/40
MYDYFKRQYTSRIKDMDPTYIPLLAGLSARFCAAAFTTPFEYIRTLIQSQTGSTWEGINLAIVRKRLFTGMGATILRDAPFSAIYWFGYEALKAKYLKTHDDSNFLVHFAAGALSGAVAATVTGPIDVIKTRIQATTTGKKRIIPTAKEIYREDGFAGFLRGLSPRLTKVAPSCAIMISSYELFKQFFEKYNKL